MTILRDSGKREFNQHTGFNRDTEDGKVKFSSISDEIITLIEIMTNAKFQSDGEPDLDAGFKEGTPMTDVPEYPLIHPLVLNRMHKVLELGAEKYDANNWLRGNYLSRSFNSAFRHLIAWHEGDTVEDHLGALMCNIMFIMVHEWMLASHQVFPDGKLHTEFADAGALSSEPFRYKIDIE